MKRTSLAIFATLLMMASYSVAATQATNNNKVSPTVQFSANIVDAVQLTITKGPSASACNIGAGSGGNDYSVDFGTVDALAINNGTCGQKYTPAQTASGHAIYYSDYNLNPVWASQPNVAGPTITAYVSTNFGAANIAMVHGGNASANPGANGFSAMSTNSGAQDTVVAAAASGTPATRWIGVDLDPSQNGAGLTGAQTAVVTFTLTVQ